MTRNSLLLKKILEILKGKVECFGRFFQRKNSKKFLENDQKRKNLENPKNFLENSVHKMP